MRAREGRRRIAQVYFDAMEAADANGDPDHAARLRAATAFLAEAFGRSAQAFRDETREPTRIVYESAVFGPP